MSAGTKVLMASFGVSRSSATCAPPFQPWWSTSTVDLMYSLNIAGLVITIHGTHSYSWI